MPASFLPSADATDKMEFCLVVGAARSGTTLMRRLLDAHPEIGCPAEAGLPALMSHMAQVWSTVHIDQESASVPTDPGQPTVPDQPRDARATDERTDAAARVNRQPQVPRLARDWIVQSAQVPMKSYCRAQDKRVYCDKSLDSVHHLGLVNQLFPGFRSLLVFRHVMDTVASGLDASPWGFEAYGYRAYSQAWPGNSVAALVNYWSDHVAAALQWEKENPEACLRIRYEDLVLSPDAIVTSIQDFLGVQRDKAVLQEAFERGPTRGPGDYKIDDTSRVHALSIGRGKRIPVAMIPPPLLERVNIHLAALGYEPLDQGWNAEERPVDAGGRGLWADRLTGIMDGLQLIGDQVPLDSFAVVTEDHHALRWVCEPRTGCVTRGDGDVDAVLTGTAEDLLQMLSSEENLGSLLRTGRVRFVVAPDQEAPQRNQFSDVRLVVTALRASVAASL